MITPTFSIRIRFKTKFRFGPTKVSTKIMYEKYKNVKPKKYL